MIFKFENSIIKKKGQNIYKFLIITKVTSNSISRPEMMKFDKKLAKVEVYQRFCSSCHITLK